MTTRGGCVIELHFHWGGLTPRCQTHQFQYRGDSQKGPVVTPQQAQAQAILQQTQVQAQLFIGVCVDLCACFVVFINKKKTKHEKRINKFFSSSCH